MLVACRKTHIFDAEQERITISDGCPACGGRLIAIDRVSIEAPSDILDHAAKHDPNHTILQMLGDGTWDNDLVMVVRRKVRITK